VMNRGRRKKVVLEERNQKRLGDSLISADRKLRVRVENIEKILDNSQQQI
jgi:hypothetical protein